MIRYQFQGRLLPGILPWCIAIAVFGCTGKQKPKTATPPLPYPDEKMSVFLQAGIDSSEFLWFTDIKSAASSFMNEFGYSLDGVSTSDIRIVGEGIFHGTVEVELSDMIITLIMERPFKHKGKDSIWQVIKVEERPWPKQKSK